MFRKVIPAIIFGVVYAVLILFGWGFGDIAGFFSHPARTIMFAVTISVNTLTMLFKDKFNVDLFLSIAGLVLAVLMSALMLLRIPKEEKMLHEVFGEKWGEFCKRTTKKVIPFVYQISTLPSQSPLSVIILKDIKWFSVKMVSLKRRKTWCKSTKGLR